MDVVDPDAIHARREALRQAVGSRAVATSCARAQARGRRRRRPVARRQGRAPAEAVALGLLAAGDPERGAELAKAQFDAADNMTDRQGALAVLVWLDAPEREQALDAFYERFATIAGARQMVRAAGGGAAAARRSTRSKRLAAHPAFTIANPNRCARWPATSPPTNGRSTTPSGRGYRFVADMILAADKLNPQVAARLVPPFGRWRRFEPSRAALMRAELERIVAHAGPVSKDVFEQASKSLA